jgi:hypothetical protein
MVTTCPWHEDRHPSLTLYENARENRCYCFACGRGGSVIDFVMASEKCDFAEACRIVAGIGGVFPDEPLAGKWKAPSPTRPKPEPKPVVKDEPLKEVFFYNIRLSDPDPDAILNRIVSWCNKYPQKGISIKGYADRGTGNPRINVGYAKARAEKVAKALQEKGVDASRMTVESFGDTVQPYDENDKNRCVIVVGE